MRVFGFAPAPEPRYRLLHFKLSRRAMIVCSCNVLTDSAIRTACQTARPRTTGQVYGCLGCSAQCGRCARTIKGIMDEALKGAACSTGCSVCPHTGKPIPAETV
jgi:bacterioferritin-associated ferredoxin